MIGRMEHLYWKLFALVLLGGLGACGSNKPPLPTLPTIANSSDARVAWTLSLPRAGVGFAPVIQGDAVFAASADGTVVRVGLSNGQVVWRQQLGVRLSSGVGADAELVVVVDRNGSVVALDGNTGAKRWTAALGTDASATPAVGLGLVIVRTGDNRVHAFDAETGRKKWMFQRQLPPLSLRQTAGIAISTGAVFVGLPGGRLAALGLNDGVPRWEQLVSLSRGTNDIERLSDIVGSPLVIGREVCVAAFQGRIACYETATGNPVWLVDFSSSSGLDLDARLVVASAANGEVQAFSREGKKLWTQSTLKRRSLSTPLTIGSVIMVGDQDGLVHFLARDDGALVGRLATDGSAILSPAAGSSKNAVVQTSNGSLIGFAW